MSQNTIFLYLLRWNDILKSSIHKGAFETRKRGLCWRRVSQLSHEKSETTLNSPLRNGWTPHIHFRGTSFSHYIVINSTGCGLYLVCSWSRPRDMCLLTHDSSLVLVLAPRYICPKTNLFPWWKWKIFFCKSCYQTSGGCWLVLQISLGERMDIFDSQFSGLDLIQSSIWGWFLNDGSCHYVLHSNCKRKIGLERNGCSKSKSQHCI